MSETRFDPVRHEYYIDGRRVPSITQLLKMAGYVDDRFYTDSGKERGQLVHALTADWDLGAITDHRQVITTLDGEFANHKGYLDAHVAAMKHLKPEMLEVEVARCSVRYGYGGRPDRVWKLWQAHGVADIKSGGHADWHGIQCALQCILLEDDYHLPPQAMQRFGLYYRSNGQWRLVEHKDNRDYPKAYEILRTFAAKAVAA